MVFEIPIYVLTSNNYVGCLPPFAYLFNKFWSPEQQVIVSCYERKPDTLPSNFTVISLGNQEDYSWSDGLIKFLTDVVDDPIFLFSLEDYFLDRKVEVGVIKNIFHYLKKNDKVKKVNLTDARLNYPHKFWETWEGIDFIRSEDGAFFQTSTQAALWKRDFMLKFLEYGESPWDFEKRGSERVIIAHKEEEFHILGTKQYPFHYINAIGGEGRNFFRWDKKKFPKWLWEELSKRKFL